MSDLDRISTLSRWLCRTVTALMVVLPLVVVAYLLRGLMQPDWLAQAFPGLPVATFLTPGKSTLVLAVGAIQLGPVLYVLGQMRALFRRYSAGEVLTPPCALHIRRAGLGLAALGIVQVVTRPVQVLVLTADNPPGQKMLTLTLGSETVWLLLASGLLVVIGRAMAEAARAAEENRGFV